MRYVGDIPWVEACSKRQSEKHWNCRRYLDYQAETQSNGTLTLSSLTQAILVEQSWTPYALDSIYKYQVSGETIEWHYMDASNYAPHNHYIDAANIIASIDSVIGLDFVSHLTTSITTTLFMFMTLGTTAYLAATRPALTGDLQRFFMTLMSHIKAT